MTLNLLRGGPLSHQPQIIGLHPTPWPFDYNCTPMAPPGIRVLVHIKPQDRATWSPLGKDGWYTGPAFESYRCYTVWIWASRSTRMCGTLTWLPTKLAMPGALSTDQILSGIHTSIVHALQHPSPVLPVTPLTTTHHDALLRLTDILPSMVVSSPPTISLAPETPTADLAPTPSLSAPPTLEPFPDPSLRVAVPAAPDNTSLRVPTPTAPNLARRTIQFAPLPSDILVATVSNSTGLHGKRAAPQNAAFSSPSATVKCHYNVPP